LNSCLCAMSHPACEYMQGNRKKKKKAFTKFKRGRISGEAPAEPRE
jgi:hypothetical protein